MAHYRWWFPTAYPSLWSSYREGRRFGEKQLPDAAEISSYGEATHLEQPFHRAVSLGKEVAARWARASRRLAEQVEAARVAYQADKTEYEEFLEESGERRFEGMPHTATWVMMVGAVLVFLCEIPMNMIVFRIFRESEIGNLVVAGCLSFFFVISAHIVGTKLKRLHRSKTDWLVVASAITASVMAILGIGYLREYYLVQMGETPSRVITLAFVAIQSLIFWGALILAYSSHAPQERENMQKSRDRWLRFSVRYQKALIVQQLAAEFHKNSAERLKDVFVGANLASRPDRLQAPLVFYLIDYNDLIQRPEELSGDTRARTASGSLGAAP